MGAFFLRDQMKYKRILLKLSGEALAGGKGSGICPEILNTLSAEIQSLVDSRANYRKNKEWKKSDLIRDKLLSLGWKLKDTPLGTKVTKI